MEKIPTARQYMLSKMKYSPIHEELLIEFAKLHVEAALSNVDRLASLKCNNGKKFRDFIDENSILNVYPLTNIK